MLECVLNMSEGRDAAAVGVVARAAGRELLDLHTDADHNRSVLTVVTEPAARAVAIAAVLRLDLRDHVGVHPRIGVLDVVPFVPLGSASMLDAIDARDRFADWIGNQLGVPAFLYGPERSLPELRRGAFGEVMPAAGPSEPHPTAGACAVGARPVLVAYNLWLAGSSISDARQIARELRSGSVRALGFEVGSQVQVSMNLIEPMVTGPADVYDQVAARASIVRAELVGLVPGCVLDRVDPKRWGQLDLSADRTIEARLAVRGLALD